MLVWSIKTLVAWFDVPRDSLPPRNKSRCLKRLAVCRD